MKEAHEPKEHECPRRRKKGLVRRHGRGFEFEHGFVPTLVRSKWIEEELERQKALEKDKSVAFIVAENDDGKGNKTQWIERARITKPGQYHVLDTSNVSNDVEVGPHMLNAQIYDEMEEKQSPVDNKDDGGPPVKGAKRVPFTLEHNSDQLIHNAQGEPVYLWCENDKYEGGKPCIAWFRSVDVPEDALQVIRDTLEPPSTIEVVTVPGAKDGDPPVEWVKHILWPPEVMAISGRFGEYDDVPAKSDDENGFVSPAEDDSEDMARIRAAREDMKRRQREAALNSTAAKQKEDDDSDEREKLNTARASMKQYAEEQLALYSKMTQEMETYFEEIRRGVGRENAMTRELNPFQLAHMHDELKSFLKQKEEEEEEDRRFGGHFGVRPSLQAFEERLARQAKLLDEYDKQYSRDVPSESAKSDDTVPRIIKMTEPVSIICADGTIVRTELITFPDDSGKDAILVIPRSVGKTGVMNCKLVFPGHGDPPPIPEKQKMEEDSKPANDSNNKRERDEEEEEEDERVRSISRLLNPSQRDRQEMRARMGFGVPEIHNFMKDYVERAELPEDADLMLQQMKEFAKKYDEAKKKGRLPPPEYVTIFDEDAGGSRDVHVSDLPPGLRDFYKSARDEKKKEEKKKPHADPLIARLQALKDDDEEEILRFRREQMLDALKGKGLEKFLEHNMPVYKDPATLAGILQHFLANADTFGITSETLAVVRAILDDENSFCTEVDRRLLHFMANVQMLNHSTDALNQLRMMIYARNDNKRQHTSDINSIVGQTISCENAYERFTHAIRFVLTQAYLKGKRPN
jgi:hypothetical protein